MVIFILFFLSDTNVLLQKNIHLLQKYLPSIAVYYRYKVHNMNITVSMVQGD